MSDPAVETTAPVLPEPSTRGALIYKVTLRILLALTVGVLVFAAKAYLFSDGARGAQVGDCVHGPGVAITDETPASAEVVDCGSAGADYEVAGRVEGTTDTDSPECDAFFAEGEKFVVYSSTGGGGYLLCLRPRAS